MKGFSFITLHHPNGAHSHFNSVLLYTQLIRRVKWWRIWWKTGKQAIWGLFQRIYVDEVCDERRHQRWQSTPLITNALVFYNVSSGYCVHFVVDFANLWQVRRYGKDTDDTSVNFVLFQLLEKNIVRQFLCDTEWKNWGWAELNSILNMKQLNRNEFQLKWAVGNVTRKH